MSARRAGAAVLALLAIGVAVWMTLPSERAAEVESVKSVESAPVSMTRPDAPPLGTIHAERAVPRPRPAPEEAPATFPAAADEPSGAVVRGRCILRDGAPAVGARVRAWSTWSTFRRTEEGAVQVGRECTVDQSGKFAISGAEDGESLVVYATLAGHHAAYPPAARPVTAPVSDIEIRFGVGGVLTGQVVGPMGKPAAGVRVRLLPANRMRHSRPFGDWRMWSEPGIWEFYAAATVTDSSGRYRFDGVPLPRNDEPQTRFAVATVDGKDWASEEVAFETDGQELERDIVPGKRPWTDVPLAQLLEEVHLSLMGRVLGPNDSAIANATVTYVAWDGPRFTTWLGNESADDGKFEFEQQTVRRGTHVEVRVAAKGFRTFRGTPGGEPMVIRLQLAPYPPLPGRIRGTATVSDGTPLTGTVVVSAADESLRVRRLAASADEQGAFVLEGLAPGEWLLYLDRDDSWRTVRVPEGGEATVVLRSRKNAAAFAPPRWTRAMNDEYERLDARMEKLRRESEDGTGDPDAIEKEWDEIWKALEPLEEPLVAAWPLREVVMTGIAKDAGTVVCASDGNREWRVEARSGIARFAGLPISWLYGLTVRVERPGFPDEEMTAGIEAGEGAQDIVFTPETAPR